MDFVMIIDKTNYNLSLHRSSKIGLNPEIAILDIL